MITVCFTNIVGRGKGRVGSVKKHELAKDGVCNILGLRIYFQ